MTDLKIEYLPVTALKPYERNARKHRDMDVDAIVKSIEEFGFDDPIGIWSASGSPEAFDKVAQGDVRGEKWQRGEIGGRTVDV